MVSPAQSKLIDASLTPAAVGSQISAAVAKKSLDAAKQQGAGILALLENAAQLQAGDAETANATGLGGTLDIVA